MSRSRQTARAIFKPATLKRELLSEARSLGLPAGALEPVVIKVTEEVGRWVAGRPMVTEIDLNRRIAAELEKYNKDLAYVYRNRGKII